MYLSLAFIVDVIAMMIIMAGIMGLSIPNRTLNILRYGFFPLVLIFCLLENTPIRLMVKPWIFFVATLYVFFLFEKKLKYTFLAIGINSVVNVVIFIFLGLDTETEWGNLITAIFATIVMCIIAIIMRNRDLKNIIQKINFTYIILCAVGLVVISLYLFDLHILLSIGEMTSELRNKVKVITYVCTCFVILLIGAFVVVQNIHNRYKARTELNQAIMKEQYQYYKMMVQKNEETKKLRHDMKNHIFCIQHLLSEKKLDELQEYVDKLNGSISNLIIQNDTGSNLINAIVGKLLEDYKEVVFECRGKFPAELNISLYDMCTIFYNLLKNAFEGAIRSNRMEKKVILHINLINNNLNIEIVNSISSKVTIKNGYIETTKQNCELHGYGIKNAKTTIEKLGGDLELSCTHDTFKTSIILVNII